MNTYIAAGIAVQCVGIDLLRPGDEENSGTGMAQVSDNAAQTPYGKPIWSEDEDGKKVFRGYGLRCYIPIGKFKKHPPCTLCITWAQIQAMSKSERKKFEEEYELEPIRNQDYSSSAVTFMRRRIEMAVDVCDNSFCTDKDRFIVAALAQNGPGFTTRNVDEIKDNYVSFNKITWKNWYSSRSVKSKREYSIQLRLFYSFAVALNKSGYILPPGIKSDSDIIWMMSFFHN